MNEREVWAAPQSPRYNDKTPMPREAVLQPTAPKSLLYDLVICRHLCPCSQPHRETLSVGVTTFFFSS